MQRSERRVAERNGRAPRTLAETDYLIGVADETRLGALRFRRVQLSSQMRSTPGSGSRF